jgi:hypothetical protein
VLSRNLPGNTEENYKTQSGLPVSEMRFEPETSWIRMVATDSTAAFVSVLIWTAAINVYSFCLWLINTTVWSRLGDFRRYCCRRSWHLWTLWRWVVSTGHVTVGERANETYWLGFWVVHRAGLEGEGKREAPVLFYTVKGKRKLVCVLN